ncbi:hypothetical protein GF336_01680 [Candidatus Woesearchaeota archaeon]|nr:hypothetical protein [Candidatus Woesearchaeota archaeon]
MRIPKRYGQSKENVCPFCGKNAVTENKQGIPVCMKHKEKFIDAKCMCGNWLDVRKGKFGPYFFCIRCGNINFRKGMEMNPQIIKDKPEEKPAKPKETILTPEEAELL